MSGNLKKSEQHYFSVLFSSILLALVSCLKPGIKKDTGQGDTNTTTLETTQYNPGNTNTTAPNTAQYNSKETTLRIQKLLADNATTLTDDLINNIAPPYKEELKNELRDIEQGKISVNHIDKNLYDLTALHKVVLLMATPSQTKECDRLVNILLNKAADPNLKDAHGRTPLEIAVELTCVTIVEVLVGRGAITTENTSMHRTC